MTRLLPIALLAALPLTLATAGCTEEKKSALPPPGMAGGNTGAPVATGAPAPGSRGAGVNPGAPAHPMGMPSSQPAAPANPHVGATSQPAANPNVPHVVKGDPMAAPPAPTGGKTLTGTVMETMNAAGYTYLKVKPADGNEFWAAVGETKIANGQAVTLEESITMSNFHSKTLDRTFPSIIFATLK